VFLSTSPRYHAAGLRYCMVSGHAGATAIIMERFDAKQTLALIARVEDILHRMKVRLQEMNVESKLEKNVGKQV